MNFQQAITSAFRNYVTFAGRASRSEYWYWVLFTIIGGIVTVILDYAAFSDSDFSTPINTIFNVVCLLPSLAVGARRLPGRDVHDQPGREHHRYQPPGAALFDP